MRGSSTFSFRNLGLEHFTATKTTGTHVNRLRTALYLCPHPYDVGAKDPLRTYTDMLSGAALFLWLPLSGNVIACNRTLSTNVASSCHTISYLTVDGFPLFTCPSTLSNKVESVKW